MGRRGRWEGERKGEEGRKGVEGEEGRGWNREERRGRKNDAQCQQPNHGSRGNGTIAFPSVGTQTVKSIRNSNSWHQ